MLKHWTAYVLALLVVAFAFVSPAGAQANLSGGHWEKIGERIVDTSTRLDTDTIAVGAGQGVYKALQIKAERDDVLFKEIKVHFGNGTSWDVPVGNGVVLDKNQRSRVIDLPGDIRVVQRVTFKYADRPGGPRAQVELWGYDMSVRLGSQAVNGKGDWDTFPVSTAAPYRYLIVNVRNSPMRLEAMRVVFADGGATVALTGLPQAFPAGQSRVFDLPGDKRTIRAVQFKYSDLPDARNAQPIVSVFGVP